jgi:ABC-type multidrug transport system fused ATPase/permease subunit
MQDRAAFAVEARLEVVARGGEQAAMRSLDGAIDRYRSVARRAAWTSAMLGRAPLAAGLAAVILAVVADASYRDAVTSAVLGQALVLAACLPILLGVLFRANELVKIATAVAPLLDVLAAPPRPELAREGRTPPGLPADIAAGDVVFAYTAGASPTLRGVSLEWPAGEALFIEGPNGSGKSTLLRLLLALRAPQEGVITIGDADLNGLDLVELRGKIAYLPQRPYLGEAQATVRDTLCALGGEKPDSTLDAALARVGLAASVRRGALLETRVGELSAGQRQRLALARVLLQDAAIYLLDEPDANLDRAGIVLVGEIVRELVEQGRMVAVAAHTEELACVAGTRLTLK